LPVAAVDGWQLRYKDVTKPYLDLLIYLAKSIGFVPGQLLLAFYEQATAVCF
jgi:hypothetical protein